MFAHPGIKSKSKANPIDWRSTWLLTEPRTDVHLRIHFSMGRGAVRLNFQWHLGVVLLGLV